MSNHKNIKKMFEKEFNIEDMKEEIISKEMKKSNEFHTLTLIPLCLTFIVGFVIITKSEDLKENTVEDKIINDIININELDKYGNGYEHSLDATTEYIEINSLYAEFPFLENLNISNDYNLEYAYKLYVPNDKSLFDCYSLHDYIINYQNSNKDIKITFSKVGSPIRDYISVREEDLVKSTINQNDVFIAQYNKSFIVTFNYNDINFEIETSNISDAELIDLLKSIIK